MQAEIKLKTLSKRINTKKEGIFYKEIQKTTIDTVGKISTSIVDKVYIVRYRDDEGKDRLVTIGKYSEGIREAYCKTQRDIFISLAKNGELPPRLEKKLKKNIITLDTLAKVYFDDKRCLTCKHCKAYKKLDNEKKLAVNLTNKDLNCDMRAKKHLLNKYNKHLSPTFGKQTIGKVKKDDIKKYIQTLRGEGKARNTINGIIQLMSAIINYSIKDKELQIINPCVGISKLETDNNRQRYLSTDEVSQLLKDLQDDSRTLLFTKLALSTGGRLQTVLNIRKKDLDLLHNSITLKDFKNNSTYTGYIDDVLVTELTTIAKTLKPNDYVIGGKPTRLSTNALSRKLRPILNKLFNAGLDKSDSKNRVVIHTLRHTFASHLAINGVPIFNIKELMNHSDINMTMRYAKLAPSSGKDAVKELYR